MSQVKSVVRQRTAGKVQAEVSLESVTVPKSTGHFFSVRSSDEMLQPILMGAATKVGEEQWQTAAHVLAAVSDMINDEDYAVAFVVNDKTFYFSHPNELEFLSVIAEKDSALFNFKLDGDVLEFFRKIPTAKIVRANLLKASVVASVPVEAAIDEEGSFVVAYKTIGGTTEKSFYESIVLHNIATKSGFSGTGFYDLGGCLHSIHLGLDDNDKGVAVLATIFSRLLMVPEMPLITPQTFDENEKDEQKRPRTKAEYDAWYSENYGTMVKMSNRMLHVTAEGSVEYVKGTNAQQVINEFAEAHGLTVDEAIDALLEAQGRIRDMVAGRQGVGPARMVHHGGKQKGGVNMRGHGVTQPQSGRPPAWMLNKQTKQKAPAVSMQVDDLLGLGSMPSSEDDPFAVPVQEPEAKKKRPQAPPPPIVAAKLPLRVASSRPPAPTVYKQPVEEENDVLDDIDNLLLQSTLADSEPEYEEEEEVVVVPVLKPARLPAQNTRGGHRSTVVRQPTVTGPILRQDPVRPITVPPSVVQYSTKEANKAKAIEDKRRADEAKRARARAENEKWERMIAEAQEAVREIRDAGVRAPTPMRVDDPTKSRLQNDYAFWKEVLKAHNVAKSSTPVTDRVALQDQITKIYENMIAMQNGIENTRLKCKALSEQYYNLTGEMAKNSYWELFPEDSQPYPTSGRSQKSRSSQQRKI